MGHPTQHSNIEFLSAICLKKDDEILDYVDITTDDTFTLESFKELCLLYEQCGKAFIIARVRTNDGQNSQGFYHSYYSAFELNKILFQTQVCQGKRLLHRMHVLNPLTNSEIDGDVHYFKLEKIFKPQIRRIESNENLKNFSRYSSSLYTFQQENTKTQRNITTNAEDMRKSVNSNFPEERSADVLNFFNKQHDPHDNELKIKNSSEIFENLEGNTQDQFVLATYIGSDLDYLQKTTMREIFKENALSARDIALFSLPPLVNKRNMPFSVNNDVGMPAIHEAGRAGSSSPNTEADSGLSCCQRLTYCWRENRGTMKWFMMILFVFICTSIGLVIYWASVR